MLQIMNMKACKHKWGVRNCYQNLEGNFPCLQNMVVLSTKHPLKVMHPYDFHEVRNASTPRCLYSHVMCEPTPTSKLGGVVFGTHIFLGPWGLVPSLTQTNLFAKFTLVCNLSKQNLASGPYVHNVYKCTHEHTCDGCIRVEHVYAVEGVHA